MPAVVLRVTDNGDGTSDVMVGTSTFGQAHVRVPTELVGTADVVPLYEHAANMQVNAYTTPRVGHRDAQRKGT